MKGIMCINATGYQVNLTGPVWFPLQMVLREFLNPRGWKPSEDSKFFLDAEQINQLCDVAEQILQGEPSVLRLRGNPITLDSGFLLLFMHSIPSEASHRTFRWSI